MEKAAYRAGEKLADDFNGKTYDYTRKGGVIHTEILLPVHAPAEYKDRSVLWNAVERSENNGNAQLARELEFSLPIELTIGENVKLAHDFVQRQFVDKGMCADVCVHDKGDGNPHAHVMLTLRPIDENGKWGAKSKKEYILDKNGERIRLSSGEYKSRKVPAVDWNEQTKAEEWRSAWADTVNAALNKNGIEKRIDHRSYERQGVDTAPSIHMGVAASQMERKGITTERGNINRNVALTNSQIRQQRTRIKHALDYLCKVPLQDAPTILSAAQRIADVEGIRSRAQKLRNLQKYAATTNFCISNRIATFDQLAVKVRQISDRHGEVAEGIRAKTRRLDTLEKHFFMNECRKQNKGVYEKYSKLQDPAKKKKYHDNHAEEIRLYKEAADYFKGVMNGRKDPLPMGKWKKEWMTLTEDKYALVREYYQLNDDIKAVEALIRGAKQMMEQDKPQRDTQTRAREIER